MKSDDHNRPTTDQYQEPASVSHDAGAKDQSREDSSGAIDQTVDKQRDDSPPSRSKSPGIPLSRRDALTSALALGGLSLFGTERALAQGQPPRQWRNDVDANGHRLDDLGALTMVANSTDILDFEGENLSIDADGVLNATDTDTHTAVSDDEGVVVDDVADITFATNLSVTDDGDGSVTVNASGGGGSPWEDSDGDGLLEAPGFDGIDVGTVANTEGPFEIVVNGERALRIEPTSSEAGSNIIAGDPLNRVASGVEGATISGGGWSPNPTGEVRDRSNKVTADFGTVGGGRNNSATGENGTVGGGSNNIAPRNGTVSGGVGNRVTSALGTIGGGGSHVAGDRGTVGGGWNNEASGTNATVPGGTDNEATGQGSFAAGIKAQARHRGAWVWADSVIDELSSTGQDQFIARATGGFWFGDTNTPDLSDGLINTSTGAYLSDGGTWTDASSRTVKENLEQVDPTAMLETVVNLPLNTWNYKDEPESIRHLSPMAEDFYERFGLGKDDRHIAALDSAGVALAAIQGLAAELDEKTEQLSELKRTNRNLRDQLTEVADRLETVEERVAPLAG